MKIEEKQAFFWGKHKLITYQYILFSLTKSSFADGEKMIAGMLRSFSFLSRGEKMKKRERREKKKKNQERDSHKNKLLF